MSARGPADRCDCVGQRYDGAHTESRRFEGFPGLTVERDIRPRDYAAEDVKRITEMESVSITRTAAALGDRTGHDAISA